MLQSVEQTTGSIAGAVRRRVERSRDRFWRVDDFASLGNRSAAQRELSRLAHEGVLRQVRRDTYWRGRQTRLGMTPPPVDRLAVEVVGERYGVGPAGFSAALALGLSTQHPRQDLFAVPRRPPAAVGSLVFKDRSARRGRVRERLNAREVALLEVLGDWTTVELSEERAVDRLGEWLRSDEVRVERLAKAAQTEPAPVRRRLRALLGLAGLAGEAQSIPAPVGDVRSPGLL